MTVRGDSPREGPVRTLPSDEEVPTAVGGNNSVGTLLLVMALGLLVIAFTRGRRQQREALGVQQRLAPGTEVMTTSGLYATVVSVEGDVLTLETGQGQRSRWDKRAVARIITPATGSTTGSTAGASTVQDTPDDADTSSDEGARRTGEEEPPPGRE